MSMSHEEFKAEFKRDNGDLKEAIKNAYEIRKFEIEMYWKRATYFWGFLISIFAGYFVMINSAKFQDHKELAFYIICLGFVFSQGWYLVNRGSKYWQENWEMMIIALEEELKAPMYSITLENENRLFYPVKGYPFSVSRINQMISLFISLFWLVVGIAFLTEHYKFSCCGEYHIPLAIIATFCFVAFGLWYQGRSGISEEKLYSFKKSDLKYRK